MSYPRNAVPSYGRNLKHQEYTPSIGGVFYRVECEKLTYLFFNNPFRFNAGNPRSRAINHARLSYEPLAVLAAMDSSDRKNVFSDHTRGFSDRKNHSSDRKRHSYEGKNHSYEGKNHSSDRTRHSYEGKNHSSEGKNHSSDRTRRFSDRKNCSYDHTRRFVDRKNVSQHTLVGSLVLCGPLDTIGRNL
jgi:hypothetical protein